MFVEPPRKGKESMEFKIDNGKTDEERVRIIEAFTFSDSSVVE
jgi:hypothetical protein